MPSQEQRTEKTRNAILRAARKLFLRHGYGGTTTAMILEETGLSKGALYHHYESKANIMEEIYRKCAHQTIDRAVEAASAESDVITQIKNICLAWLREVQSRQVFLILFAIGPGALGLEKAKKIEDEYAISLFVDLLQQGADKGEVHLSSPELMIRMLNGVLTEAALHMHRADTDVLEQVNQTLEAMLSGLRTGK